MTDELDGLKELIEPDDGYYDEDDKLVDADDLVIRAIELDADIKLRLEDTDYLEIVPFHYAVKYDRAPEANEGTYKVEVHYFGNNGRHNAQIHWTAKRSGPYAVYTADDDYILKRV